MAKARYRNKQPATFPGEASIVADRMAAVRALPIGAIVEEPEVDATPEGSKPQARPNVPHFLGRFACLTPEQTWRYNAFADVLRLLLPAELHETIRGPEELCVTICSAEDLRSYSKRNRVKTRVGVEGVFDVLQEQAQNKAYAWASGAVVHTPGSVDMYNSRDFLAVGLSLRSSGLNHDKVKARRYLFPDKQYRDRDVLLPFVHVAEGTTLPGNVVEALDTAAQLTFKNFGTISLGQIVEIPDLDGAGHVNFDVTHLRFRPLSRD